MKKAVLFLAMGLFCCSGFAATFESGTRQVTLLEVYSSQGCSSCPPADDWVRGFLRPSNLWKAYVPVVFHVDYWDGQGWKDPFGSNEFTLRQRAYAAVWRMNTVFTPAVVIQGRIWANWQRIRTLPTFNRDVGVLRADQQGPGQYRIVFDPVDKKEKRYEAHLALLGFNIESVPSRGENAGKRLKHDFVVLRYQRAPMQGLLLPSAAMNLSTHDSRAKKFGIAVWVTEKGDPRPVQATGGYLQ